MHLFFQNDRPAPVVSLQPYANPIHWRILRRNAGTLHTTAQLASGPLRLTSALVAVDLSRGLVKTESGRSYSLSVPPEQDQLVQALLVANAVRGMGAVSDDVSDAVWSAISSGAWIRKEALLLPSLQ